MYNRNPKTTKMFGVEYTYFAERGTRFNIFKTFSAATEHAHNKQIWGEYCQPVAVFVADFDPDDICYDDMNRIWDYEFGEYTNREDLEIFMIKGEGKEWIII